MGTTNLTWDMRTHTPKRKRQRTRPEWGLPLTVNGNGKTTHFCRGCTAEKPITEFYRASGQKQGHQSRCRDCQKKRVQKYWQANRARRMESARRWRQRSKEQMQAYERARSLRSYGYSQTQYEQKLAAQNGCCPICGRTPAEAPNRKSQRFPIDHDHATGQIRDLLCINCNSGLGSFKDDIERLLAAVEYLRRWKAVTEQSCA